MAGKTLRWLNRNSLNDLLTRELQEVAGCEGASINVGPSRDACASSSAAEPSDRSPADVDAAVWSFRATVVAASTLENERF